MVSILLWIQRVYMKVEALYQQFFKLREDVSLQKKAFLTLIDVVKQLNEKLGVVQDQNNQLLEQNNSLLKQHDSETELLNEIKLLLVGNGAPAHLTLTYFIEGVEQKMPLQITDTQAFIAVPAEKDPLGNVVDVDPTQMSYGVSDPSAFDTQTNNTSDPVDAPDGSKIPVGAFWAKAKQEAGHLGDFQVTSQDTKNGLNSQDTVTVVSAGATSLTMNLSVAGTV